MIRTALSMGALFSLVALSCTPKGPAEILPGDRCAHCQMHITDPRFAAQYLLPDGTFKKFDDIGCMVLSYRKEKTPVKQVWVRTFDTGKWIPAREAVFVKGYDTPMGYGYVAFASGTTEGVTFTQLLHSLTSP